MAITRSGTSQTGRWPLASSRARLRARWVPSAPLQSPPPSAQRERAGSRSGALASRWRKKASSAQPVRLGSRPSWRVSCPGPDAAARPSAPTKTQGNSCATWRRHYDARSQQRDAELGQAAYQAMIADHARGREGGGVELAPAKRMRPTEDS